MHRLYLIACVILLVGCGWQLRGYEQFQAQGADKISALHLTSKGDNRLMQRTLSRQMEDLAITQDEQAAHRLVLLSENVERRPISFSSTGIPLQYQLIMTVRYAMASRRGENPTENRLQARREYDFDTQVVVAKNEEERQLLQEMREELAGRMIASLSQ